MGEISKSFTKELFQAFYRIEEDQSGLRLDQFCALYMPSFSRQQIKKKIKDGEVKIHDRPYPHKASVKVYENETVELFTPRGTLEDEYWRGEKLDLQFDPEIIFEDENILAVSKPAYMTTHPTGKHLFNCATVYFEDIHKKTIHSIHRLDRETSGVQLLAKNPSAAQKATAYFEKDLVSKCYFFMAHKKAQINFPVVNNKRLGSLDDFIPRLFVHCFEKDSKQGKRAQTTFKLIYETNEYILGLAFPQTGRQHQIRAHAADLGFPLIGDKLYNGDPRIFMRFKDEIPTTEDHDIMQLSRHALHAVALKIPYPSADKPSIFKASLPNDFIKWINENLSEVKIDEMELKIKNEIEKSFES